MFRQYNVARFSVHSVQWNNPFTSKSALKKWPGHEDTNGEAHQIMVGLNHWATLPSGKRLHSYRTSPCSMEKKLTVSMTVASIAFGEMTRSKSYEHT